MFFNNNSVVRGFFNNGGKGRFISIGKGSIKPKGL